MNLPLPRRKKLVRPSYLSDAILTKAATAGNQRLLERVGIMKAEFRNEVTTRIEQRRKALTWIKRHAIAENFVGIGQFASSMKMKTANAVELVGKLIRGNYSEGEVENTFFIFVTGNQIPEWLRPMITKAQTAALINRARLRYSSFMDRQVHDEVLAETYGKDFYDYLVETYKRNELDVMKAIVSSGFDIVAEAPSPFEPMLDGFRNLGWAQASYGSGQRRVFNTLPNGTRVELGFGSVKLEVLDETPDDKPALLEHRPHKDEAKHYTEEQVIERYNAAQKLVNLMFESGLYLVNTSMSYSPNNGRYRSSYMFARKDDLASSVRVTLPWDFLMFRKVK